MNEKILLVEDERTEQTLISFLLKSHQYEVVLAADGEEGLQKARQEKPDLIVLDVMMPKVDGLTFVRELRARTGSDAPPIIMLTSRDQMQDVFRLEGVSDYFVKPVETKKFIERIYQLLRPHLLETSEQEDER